MRPIPNLEVQVSVFMSPSHRVAQLYPQAPGSVFVAYYDLQGCGGSILTHLHTEMPTRCQYTIFRLFRTFRDLQKTLTLALSLWLTM
jgi:hypothetical protein